MKPVLFNKLKAKFPEFKSLSVNKVSKLPYKELRSVAKAFHANGIFTGPYQSVSKEELQQIVYNKMKTL